MQYGGMLARTSIPSHQEVSVQLLLPAAQTTAEFYVANFANMNLSSERMFHREPASQNFLVPY
jgi:hypothetical protein